MSSLRNSSEAIWFAFGTAAGFVCATVLFGFKMPALVLLLLISVPSALIGYLFLREDTPRDTQKNSWDFMQRIGAALVGLGLVLSLFLTGAVGEIHPSEKKESVASAVKRPAGKPPQASRLVAEPDPRAIFRPGQRLESNELAKLIDKHFPKARFLPDYTVHVMLGAKSYVITTRKVNDVGPAIYEILSVLGDETAGLSQNSSVAGEKASAVIIGMTADAVLKLRGRAQSLRQVGPDENGLLVDWEYPDVTYQMGRRAQDGTEAYRVVKITPRK